MYTENGGATMIVFCGDVEIICSAPTTIHSLTDRVHVWTSTALGSNNCILDVSKHGIFPVLRGDWAITLPGER